MKKICTHNCIIYILSFILPVFILTADFAFWQIYPLGNRTVLITDLYHQYIHYYSYLYDAVKGNDSLLYSWHAGLGGNFIGTVAYYASSPFLAVIFLFSKKYLAEAAMALILLKIGSAGLAMSIFIRKKFPALPALEVILFSAFFALMSYNVIYYYNVMWLDGLIWLPLIVLSTDLLIYKKKVSLFIFFLALMFLSNFYISYMIGLFIFLYFVSEMMMNRGKLTGRELLGTSGKFIFGVFIAAGISSIFTIPTFYQIMLSESAPAALNSDEAIVNFNILHLLYKMFGGVYDTVKTGGTPNVFIGSFVWILVPAYFLNKQIRKADKIRWGALLLILLLSMEIPILNIAWHGFDPPTWFPYRYSFIFSFLLLLISLKAYQEIASIKFKRLVVFYLIPISVILINLIYAEEELKLHPVLHVVFISIFCIIIILKIKNYKVLLHTLLILYTVGELAFNTVALNMNLLYELGTVYRERYTIYNDYSHKVKELKEREPAFFYRVETDINKTNNDSLSTGHGSFSHSSSMVSDELIDTLKALGFTTRIVGNYNKNGGTFVTDSLLGLKYVIHSKDMEKDGYRKVLFDKNLNVYENMYALPIGFIVSDRIKDVDPADAKNPFELQNNIVQKISNKNIDLFEQISPIKTEYINTEVRVNDGVKHLIRKNEERPIRIKHEFFIQNKSRSHFYTLLTTSENAEIMIDKKWIGAYPSPRINGIMDTGTLQDEPFTMEVSIDEEDVKIKQEWFYVGDFTEFPDLIGSIDHNSFQITHLDGTRMEGFAHVKQDNELLFLSIPWDEGWTVEVDERKTAPVKVLGAFMGIPLSQGEHEIKLHFAPKGFVAGRTISLISLLLLLAVWWKERTGIKARERKGIDASG